jgi:FkbM family methyltransferase
LSHPRNGRYVGFEPIPECAAFLQAIVDGNRLDNCSIIPAGIASKAGVVRLSVPDGDLSSASMIEGLRPGREERALFVPMTDITSVPLRLEDISLVKIDVEGAESEVLRGLASVLSDRPPIICEVLTADSRAEMDSYAARISELTALLSELGYQPQRIEKHGTSLAGFAPIDGFPLERWTPEHSERCDYLFSVRPPSVEAR